MSEPTLRWDSGTAYDFFMSLKVLHEPEKWGLRGAWAKGVRARLSAENQAFLKDIQNIVFIPMLWLHELPQPKNATTFLQTLATLPVEQRLREIAFVKGYDEWPADLTEVFERVATTKTWSAKDVDVLYEHNKEQFSLEWEACERALYWWANAEEFGEKIVGALQSYYDVFFAEEEQRILPYLEQALARAQKSAETKPFVSLIEQLTGGIRLDPDQLTQHKEIILVPSYWATPMLIMGAVNEHHGYFMFGARPSTASLVPGEVVPDALHQSLKALANPTRLKILRYLSAEPHTPTELAKKLRLRAPTVIHHLHTLRLAQLVYITISTVTTNSGVIESKRYAARTEAIAETMNALQTFLTPSDV